MNLPEVDVSPEPLYRMCYAFIQSQLLLTGIELKIFNILCEPKTAEQVAHIIGGHPQNTLLFLNGLAACELVNKKHGVFRNTPIAQTFLVEGKPTSLGEGFIRQIAMSEKMLKNLSQRVLEGPPATAPENPSDSPEQWGSRALWMANHERAGIAQQMAAIVSALPEFPSFTKMLDLGGGPGIFGIAMVAKHPTMRGIIFDRKPVVDVARRFIAEYGLENRMAVLAGDYNQDDVGRGYDLIWASSTLNFAQHHMETVMAKICNALNPGGVFINLSEGLIDEGTRPDFFVMCTMGWAMSNPMSAFEQGVIADAMLHAGFRSVKSRTLLTGWGPMDLDIARK